MSTPVVRWKSAGSSDCGPIRRHNEDSFSCSDDIGLFVVADGMGGHAAGEVAAHLAVDVIAGFIRRSHDDDEYSWPYGISPTLSLNANRLRTAVHLANRRIFRAAEGCDDYTGMGSTVVAALVWANHVAIAHVGDSRLYRWRDGTLEQMTQDDSWAALMLSLPPGGEAPPPPHPMRNVLTKVLGAREATDVHVQEHTTKADDVLLLCSDGVHTTLSTETIAALLADVHEPEEAALALVQCAIKQGSRDNVTALVAAGGKP